MTKIKAKNLKIAGTKLNIPVDGIIDIDANGIASVSEKAARVLVNGTNDWEYFDDSEEETADAGKDLISNLKKMTIEQLIELAKEAGYPEEEYTKFANAKKNAAKLMAAYLTKKYNEASVKAAEDELKADEDDSEEETADAGKESEEVK